MAKESDYIYITTSIAYANSQPHIGFALELLQADVLARFYRQQGKKVFFLTGTDEHGSKIAQTAAVQGITPQELADHNAAKFRELTGLLNLSNDDFIRTTDRQKHWPGVIKMWKRIAARGDLNKNTYQGLYCVGCEAFITEKELIKGKCPNHDREPEKIEEENYFFRLGKYRQQIIDKIESEELKILPLSRRREILNILRSGYENVSFSRPRKKLNWGIPVPGDDRQIMYVWCDALTNYVSAIGFADESRQFNNLWEQGRVIHFIGKDILRFHAAIWPAMLLSAGLKLPNLIFTHGFITSEGKKMSKSLGNVVDPFVLLDKFGVDPVRYYLLREIPTDGDGDFSLSRFQDVYTSDLANGLGNLVSRVTNMISSYLGGRVEPADVSTYFNWLRIDEYTEKIEYEKALQEIWQIVAAADKMIDEGKPWQLMKTGGAEEQKEVEELLSKLAGIILKLSDHLQPYLPTTAIRIKDFLQGDITKSPPLFPRL